MEKKKRNQLWRLPLLILSLAVLAYSIAFLFWGLVPCVGKIELFAETDSDYIISGWPRVVTLPFIYWILWNVIFVIISTSTIVLVAYHLGKKPIKNQLLIWNSGLSLGIAAGLIMLFTADVVVGLILAAVVWFAFRKNSLFLGSMLLGVIVAVIFGFLFSFIYSILIIFFLLVILTVVLVIQALARTPLCKRIRGKINDWIAAKKLLAKKTRKRVDDWVEGE